MGNPSPYPVFPDRIEFQRNLATSVNEAGRKMLAEEEKAGKDAAKEKERAEKAAAAVAVAADTSGMSLADGQSTGLSDFIILTWLWV